MGSDGACKIMVTVTEPDTASRAAPTRAMRSLERAFLLGVEVLYARVDTAFEGQQLILTPTQGRRPTGVYTARDQNVVAINFRAQRGFGGVGE